MTNWGAAPAQLKRWNDEENRRLRRMMEMALCYGPTESTKKEPKMSEVKINVCGVEMTPDQAKKVYQELGKLFSLAPTDSTTDRFPTIDGARTTYVPPVFLQQPGLGFEHAKKSPD